MKPQTMRKVRQFHHYLGIFFAPAIFFFAATGSYQVFRLQQASGWGGAEPPAAMAFMASVHTDQARPKIEAPKPAEARRPIDPARAAERDARKRRTLPLKIFTLLMGIALMLSSLLGVVIALNIASMRRASVMLLVAGSVLPLLLLA